MDGSVERRERTRILRNIRQNNIVRDDFPKQSSLRRLNQRLQFSEQESKCPHRKRLELAKEERRILKLKGILEGLEQGKKSSKETMSILLDLFSPILQLRK